MIAEIDPQSVRLKVGYSLPTALVRRLRLAAAREDRRQYEIIEAALADYLGRREVEADRPADVPAARR